MNGQQTNIENQIAELSVQQKQALFQQAAIIREFFQTDNVAEIIGSLNAMTEIVLFSSDVQHVTKEMRTDIVNNLRVVTLLARLDVSQQQIKS